MRMFPQAAGRLRLRRRTGVLAGAALVVLTAAGGAFAWHGFSSASLVSATFSATTVSNSQSETCTASNNDSIQVTEATYTGTAASSDAHLAGPVTIHARSVFDATTKTGTVWAGIGITNAAGGFRGSLVTVNANGTLQGFLAGFEGGGGQVLGNVSSGFSTTGGFTGANVGTGTGTNTAIVSTSSCQSNDDDEDDDSGDHGFGGFGKVVSIGGHHQGGGDSQH